MFFSIRITTLGQSTGEVAPRIREDVAAGAGRLERRLPRPGRQGRRHLQRVRLEVIQQLDALRREGLWTPSSPCISSM